MTCVPGIIVFAAMGREMRRGLAKAEAGVKDGWFRPAMLAGALFLVMLAAPIPKAMLGSIGLHAFDPLFDGLALLSPPLLLTEAAFALGIQVPAPTGAPPAGSLAAAGAGFALQLAVALVARRFERRRAATDGFVPAPMPPPDH